MLKNDGKYEIFIVEHKNNNEWHVVNYNNTFKILDNIKNFNYVFDNICYAETGILGGNYDVEKTMKLYVKLQEYNPGEFFRLSKKIIWQDSEIIYES